MCEEKAKHNEEAEPDHEPIIVFTKSNGKEYIDKGEKPPSAGLNSQYLELPNRIRGKSKLFCFPAAM